jgi:glutathionyl-hydroquinone reductase
MGQLVDGVWTEDALIKKSADGRFRRADASLRNWITPDGSHTSINPMRIVPEGPVVDWNRPHGRG